jgi:predicted ester cyclase
LSAEDNKAVTRRFIDDVVNGHDLAAVDRYIDPNFVEHNPLPGQAPGPEGFKQGMGGFFSAFPDLHHTVDVLLAEGDYVVVRGTSRGTQSGEFLGIPATGKQVEMTEIHIVRLANGRMAEHWGEMDAIGLMQQLGAMPAPGPH